MIDYYELVLYASFVLSLVYAYMWHKRFNINFTLIFVVIPLANFGYSVLAHADTKEEAFIGIKLGYLGGCFELLFMLFSVFGLCKIDMPNAVRGLLLSFVTLVCMSVLTIGNTNMFYVDPVFKIKNGFGVIEKEYGIGHYAFVLMVIACLAVSMGVLIYTSKMRNDVSHSILRLLVLPGLISACSYFFARSLKNNESINLIPLSYVISQFIFLLIIRRVNLYDTSDTAIDSLANTGTTAFISVDRKFRYLGGNETASRFFPQLNEMRVDKPISGLTEIGSAIIRWIKVFSEDNSKNKVMYKSNGRIYLISITYLYDGRKKRGFQFFITDDTRNQMAEKAKHIVEMQDKLLLGMATMVESRDNSTGGHIKRTSDGVRILIDQMKADGSFNLSEEFCRSVIKAAPLHDLGKIAVDDAILRKPGRFTPEEFEKMKRHAAEGARIVREILSDSDETEFRRIAENVAHYHHERWDGSGYPEGLAGEAIPLEARIMAIADVYDALVSKRVYKESMSFEQANAIIMEGMGKHFDQRLERIFVAARPRLELYYSSLEESKQPTEAV